MRFTNLKLTRKENAMTNANARFMPQITELQPILSLGLRRSLGQFMKLVAFRGSGSSFTREYANGIAGLQALYRQIEQSLMLLDTDESFSIELTLYSRKHSPGYRNPLWPWSHSAAPNNSNKNVLGQKSCSKSTTPLSSKSPHDFLKNMRGFVPLFAFQFPTTTRSQFPGASRPHQCPGETAKR